MNCSSFAAAVAVAWQLLRVANAQPRRATLLELQRTAQGRPPFFSAPQAPSINVTGFCKRVDCEKPPCAPVCTEQPCCCWSTYAMDEHPTYPAPDAVKEQQQCLYPPKGWVYAPEPGLSYNDGLLETIRLAGLPAYPGRRLCCLRRKDGVHDDSQRDLRMAVSTTTTTTTTTEGNWLLAEDGTKADSQIDPVFTTEAPTTTSLLNPGDEYENAQMEKAARAHLKAAYELEDAAAALNSSADALEEIGGKLQNDPNLRRKREHVARIRQAIYDWAVRRWANLKRLSSGDPSTFDNGPRPPPGLT